VHPVPRDAEAPPVSGACDAGHPGAVTAPKRGSGPGPAVQGGPPPRRSADPARILRCSSARLRAGARGRFRGLPAALAPAAPKRSSRPRPEGAARAAAAPERDREA
jgi:hypothetical protein